MASNPLLRHDKYTTFKTGGITFAMDNGCLLIDVEKPEDYPISLTAMGTHRLLNMLFDSRADIIAASKAMQAFGSGTGRRNIKRGR